MDPLYTHPLTHLQDLESHAALAEVAQFGGHSCLRLENGLVLLPFTGQDLSLEVEIAAPGPAYPGLVWRALNAKDYELAYAQPHTSGLWDALQYDPIFNGANTWQVFHGPAYQQAAEVPTGQWFHLRVDCVGERAALSINGCPPLVVEGLAHPLCSGRIGLWTYLPAFYRNLRVTPCTGITQAGILAAAPSGAWLDWMLEGVGQVACEPNGILNLNRFIDRELFTGPRRISRRFIVEQPGVTRLTFGFSDQVAVFVDGQEVFRGENYFCGMPAGYEGRGYVRPDHHALELPLPPGEHWLRLELDQTEPFGWGLAVRHIG